MRSVCRLLTDSAMLYTGLTTMSKPRCQVESVSVPEADWESVVPPNPPAALSARVYWTLAEPGRKSWTRLVVPAGGRIGGRRGWVTVGPRVPARVGARVRRRLHRGRGGGARGRSARPTSRQVKP